MKVLYLTPWYPDEHDAMAGLFVLKHADAVRAQGVDVQVIHSLSWCDTLRQWHRLKRTWGLPDVVQLNVVQKQGLLAWWLKRHYGIPYIIVDHWSGYLPENGQYMQMSAMKRRVLQKICANSTLVLTVSEPLQRAMRECGLRASDWGQIDNVVDDFFYSAPQDNGILTSRDSDNSTSRKIKTLLHVSCFDERAKNVKGLLRAAKALADKRQDWQLVLVGTGVDYQDIRSYAKSLNLHDGLLQWTGEQTPREVAAWMRRADALVLCSRYETYGIVLAEAAAVGLPIISTPVGIAEDVHATIVQQNEVENHPNQFADKIEQVLFCNKPAASRDIDTKRFTSQAIGAKFKKLYEQAYNYYKYTNLHCSNEC